MAEDIQNVLDEKVRGGLRVLPILGRGGAHNALDVLLLKGVDMGVMEKDDINTAKRDEPVIFANASNRLNYITKLANNEYQLIARPEIKTIRDLDGKKVNFLKKLSSTHIACRTIFTALGINVQPVFIDQESATVKLRKGEIAAFARYAPAPHGAFKGLKASEGFHFLAIDDEVLSPDDYGKLLKSYSPALLKHDIYPDLVPEGQPVPTVAGSLLLVTYAWPRGTERYQRVANFVDKFFSKIDKFKSKARHPKWKEINLAYNVPGWTRFGPARKWLDTHKPAVSDTPADLRTAFNNFLSKQSRTNPGRLTKAERDAMFKIFLQWWKARKQKP
ncbi:MAG: TAXI family TRAP transporter solute-binding subunit [Alphaproteobacteria bacterium]